MHVKSALMIRVLLNRLTKASPEAALKALPPSEIDEILKIDVSSKEFLPAFASPLEALKKIHYSWLAAPVQKLPAPSQPYALAALPAEVAKKLGQSLNVVPSPQPLSNILKAYLAQALIRHIKGFDQVIPKSYLPQSELGTLVEWNKNALVELIEFIGIHDLSEEIRHIVNKKILQNVYSCLTQKEQQYLKMCMHIKDKVSTPSLGLDKWNGNCAKLKSVLQTRGLLRLGKGLSGEHPDFIWHLVHTLDTGRGKALLKYYSKNAVPGITVILAQQISYLMNFLKKKSD